MASENYVSNLSEWIFKGTVKKYILFLTSAITLLSLAGLSQLRFNFELEELFPGTDEDILFYNDHIQTYGYDNDFISIMVIPETTIYQWDFLENISELVSGIEQVDGVEWVFSPLKLKKVFNSPTGLVSFPLFTKAPSLTSDSIFVAQDPYLKKFLPNDKFLSLTLRHTHFKDQNKSVEFLNLLENELTKSGVNYKWIGKTIAEKEFLGYIRSDFLLFLSLAIGLSIIALYLITRSLRNAVFPVIVGALSLLWVFGLMAWWDIPINIMTSLLPPILIFTSSSDTIHLLSAHQKAGNRHKAIQTVFIPTALTSITTALGFFSLMIVDVKPIQILGLSAGIGTIIAFVITYCLCPYFLSKHLESSPTKEYFQPFFSFQKNNRVTIIICFSLLAVLGIYSTSKLEVDARLLEDLPQNSLVRQNFQLADSLLRGSKPMELAIQVKDTGKTVWHPRVLHEIEKITSYLENEFPLSNVVSPSSAVKYASYLRGKGYDLQQLDKPTINLAKRILRQTKVHVIGLNQMSARITGNIQEYGSKNTSERNEKMINKLNENIDQRVLTYRITGTNYLIDKSHEQLARQILNSLLTAIGLVSVLLGIYFRSFRITIIALVPNLLPLLLLGGCIYLFQIPIQLSTSIIFALAFGIVVDDTIHFLAMYRKALFEAVSNPLAYTLEHAGKGMINTSLVLVVGFSTFMFSSFGATFYLGIFLCLSLVIALLTDFLLLPLLLNNGQNLNPSRTVTNKK